MVNGVKKALLWLRKPENFFITTSLIVGIAITVILPPFRGPDEASHVFRVYEFTQGDLLLDRGISTKTGLEGNGFMIPDSISRVNQAGFNNKEKDYSRQHDLFYREGEKRSDDKETFEVFEGAGLYSPLLYASYLPASFVAHTTNTNSYIYTVILRISGLVISCLLIYLAVRLIPIGKWFIVAIGLLPMSLHQMAVISTDGLIISSTLLFVALILYARTNFTKLSTKQHLGIATLLLFTGACLSSKPGYWPVLLLVFLVIPKFKELTKKPFIYYIAATVLSAFIYVGWYGLITINHQSDMKSYFEQANPHSKLITKREFAHQIINPVTFVSKFYSTYIEQPAFKKIDGDLPLNFQPSFMFNSFTGFFGSLNILPPSWLSLTVIGSLLVAFLAGYKEKKLYKNLFGRKEKVIPLIGLVGSFIAVSVIFWMSWTTSDMPFIFGVQGRYFIPLLALFVFFIPSKKIINLRDNIVLRALVVLFLINSYVMLTSIYNYFYV